jgi:hypothetical protein
MNVRTKGQTGVYVAPSEPAAPRQTRESMFAGGVEQLRQDLVTFQAMGQTRPGNLERYRDAAKHGNEAIATLQRFGAIDDNGVLATTNSKVRGHAKVRGAYHDLMGAMSIHRQEHLLKTRGRIDRAVGELDRLGCGNPDTLKDSIRKLGPDDLRQVALQAAESRLAARQLEVEQAIVVKASRLEDQFSAGHTPMQRVGMSFEDHQLRLCDKLAAKALEAGDIAAQERVLAKLEVINRFAKEASMHHADYKAIGTDAKRAEAANAWADISEQRAVRFDDQGLHAVAKWRHASADEARNLGKFYEASATQQNTDPYEAKMARLALASESAHDVAMAEMIEHVDQMAIESTAEMGIDQAVATLRESARDVADSAEFVDSLVNALDEAKANGAVADPIMPDEIEAANDVPVDARTWATDYEGHPTADELSKIAAAEAERMEANSDPYRFEPWVDGPVEIDHHEGAETGVVDDVEAVAVLEKSQPSVFDIARQYDLKDDMTKEDSDTFISALQYEAEQVRVSSVEAEIDARPDPISIVPEDMRPAVVALEDYRRADTDFDRKQAREVAVEALADLPEARANRIIDAFAAESEASSFSDNAFSNNLRADVAEARNEKGVDHEVPAETLKEAQGNATALADLQTQQGMVDEEEAQYAP